jgi:hypothetical protein
LYELRILVDSIGYMADKHQVKLLSLSPDKEERKKIAEYVEIMKSLSRISRSLLQIFEDLIIVTNILTFKIVKI